MANVVDFPAMSECTWEVSAPGLQPVVVEAPNWVAALGLAVEQYGDGAIPGSMACELLRSGAAVAHDFENKRRYVIRNVVAASESRTDQGVGTVEIIDRSKPAAGYARDTEATVVDPLELAVHDEVGPTVLDPRDLDGPTEVVAVYTEEDPAPVHQRPGPRAVIRPAPLSPESETEVAYPQFSPSPSRDAFREQETDEIVIPRPEDGSGAPAIDLEDADHPPGLGPAEEYPPGLGPDDLVEEFPPGLEPHEPAAEYPPGLEPEGGVRSLFKRPLGPGGRDPLFKKPLGSQAPSATAEDEKPALFKKPFGQRKAS